MSTLNEPSLLVQASYPVQEKLLEQIIEVCKSQELSIAHLYQRELNSWYMLELEINGVWHQLVKFEARLAELNEALSNGQIFWQRLTQEPSAIKFLPYIVQVQTLMDTGIIDLLTDFFDTQGIKLKEVLVNRYTQSKTLLVMQNITLCVYLPVEVNLPELRESLMIMCEQYNLDIIFEQDRG